MSGHFLLSAKARSLSLKAIYRDGEDKAYDTFRRLRWPETNGEAVCPRCGCCESYGITTRRRFKCKACLHMYSVTSGTIFASRKLAFTDLLAGIAIFVNAVKGLSALQLSRDLNVQYKTAWVLAHKIREALASEMQGFGLSGEVEIDGAYFGGHIRPENRKEDRIDRRLKEHQTGRRRVVVALRERQGRTRTFVVHSEAEGVEIARKHVAPTSSVFADEASHWDELHTIFPNTGRVNHSMQYADGDDHTNWVESYFSRLRRMVDGQHHHVSARYLYQYAAEAAWKEDHRRNSNGAAFSRTLRLALLSPVSPTFARYWQRSRRAHG
jgi:transposase-like protein